jgi:hypothetical protein
MLCKQLMTNKPRKLVNTRQWLVKFFISEKKKKVLTIISEIRLIRLPEVLKYDIYITVKKIKKLKVYKLNMIKLKKKTKINTDYLD